MEAKTSPEPEPTEPARNVGSVFSPLNEELAFLPGHLAPRQHDHLVHVARWMPFGCASRMLEDLFQVHVGKETARRLCEDVGTRVEEKQTTESQRPWKEETLKPEDLPRLAMSADGAMVPLAGGEWADVRTLAIGDVPPCPTEHTSLTQVPVGKRSSFSRLTDAATFPDVAAMETRRRTLVSAKEVCAVMDGADWLQAFVDIHRGDAVRIRDVAHAAEHLAKLLEAVVASGKVFPPQMRERCVHVRTHRGPDSLLRMADRLTEPEMQREEVREHLGSVRKRLALMQDPTVRRSGWPMGSGMVERANTLVVEARRKGTGMRWERTHVNPMLA